MFAAGDWFGMATTAGLVVLLCIGTLHRPAAAIAAALCLYGIKQWGQSTSAFFAEYRIVANYLAAALVIYALMVRLRQHRVRMVKSRAWVAMLILFGYSLVTLAWAPELSVSVDWWVTQGPYILLFGVLVPLLIESSDDVVVAARWTIGIALAVGLLALLFGRWGDRGLVLYGRGSADVEDTTNPLAIAQIGGYLFLAALLMLPQKRPWLVRAVLLLSMSVGVALMLRSGSRGQLYAAAICGVLTWPLTSRKIASSVFVSLPLVAVCTAILGWEAWQYVVGTGAVVDRWTALESSMAAEGRMTMALSLAQTAFANPLTAIFGLGNSSSWHYLGIYTHITVMEVLSEEGLLGFAIYLFAMAAAAVECMRLAGRRNADNSDATRYSCALAISLFVFELILSQKQGTLLGSYYVLCFIGIIGQLNLAVGESPQEMPESIAPVAARFPNIVG